MIKLMLSEIVEAIGGKPGGPVPTISLSAVSTDSREMQPGGLFFALTGPRFDGHDFVAAALRAGAAAAVVAADRAADVHAQIQALERPVPPGVLIAVPDTLAALARLATWYRDLISAAIVAVVGSNGKTTTKAMIHHILAGSMRGHSSPKSFNNQIGVPLTLLSADAADEFVIVEIGTSAPGEVAGLATIVRPDLAVITGVAEEHLEGLGDLDGVAAEECSVLTRLSAGGFAAVNIDAPVVRRHLPAGDFTVVTFGWDAAADVRLTDVRDELSWLHFRLNGRFGYRMPVPGRHNAVNAAGAITIARRLGLEHAEIAGRLETFALPPMRTELLTLGAVTVINDAYNANPASAAAAFDLLESVPCDGRRIVVFGEMRELGARSAELHRRVGERLIGRGFERVYLVGAAAELMSNLGDDGRLFGPHVQRCTDVDDCCRRLQAELRAGDVVLLKASRAVGLDTLVEPLRRHFGAGLPAPRASRQAGMNA